MTVTTPRIAGFNTQPPEGGWTLNLKSAVRSTSFNTQPPEGGWIMKLQELVQKVCFNTQPPEGGWWTGRLGAC